MNPDHGTILIHPGFAVPAFLHFRGKGYCGKNYSLQTSLIAPDCNITIQIQFPVHGVAERLDLRRSLFQIVLNVDSRAHPKKEGPECK